MDLSKEIEDTLTMYSRNIYLELSEVVEEVGKDALNHIKNIGDYNDRTGKYRKSFRLKKVDGYKKVSVKLYASGKHYRLTHLLEHGYMKADGTGRVKAHPHWQETEEKAVEEFERKLQKKLGEVGV